MVEISIHKTDSCAENTKLDVPSKLQDIIVKNNSSPSCVTIVKNTAVCKTKSLWEIDC